jgi:hypothetical protein
MLHKPSVAARSLGQLTKSNCTVTIIIIVAETENLSGSIVVQNSNQTAPNFKLCFEGDFQRAQEVHT